MPSNSKVLSSMKEELASLQTGLDDLAADDPQRDLLQNELYRLQTEIDDAEAAEAKATRAARKGTYLKWVPGIALGVSIIAIVAIVTLFIGLSFKATKSDVADLKYDLMDSVDSVATHVAAAKKELTAAISGKATATYVNSQVANLATYEEVFGVKTYDELPKRIVSIDTTYPDEPDTTWQVIPAIELARGGVPVQVAKQEAKAASAVPGAKTSTFKPRWK